MKPAPHHAPASPAAGLEAQPAASTADSGLPGLQGLSVFQRGWLSSNNVLIHPADGEAGAVLVDSSHVNHSAQTVALVAAALNGGRAGKGEVEPGEQGEPIGRHGASASLASRERQSREPQSREPQRSGLQSRLARIINTHLHSDHCGGNAALQMAFGAPITVAPGMARHVNAWDASRLSHATTGQRCARFSAADELTVGEPLRAGGRDWQVLAAPGHDADSVVLFDAEHGVLISADALWENGFGVVFPELAGEPGFSDVAAVLDQIAALPVRTVIPGHGAPFTDVAGALARARARLAGFQAQPLRHARHAAKVLIKYHLMEEREMAPAAFEAWAAATPLMQALWQTCGAAPGASAQAWAWALSDELVHSGALRRLGEVLADA